MSTALKPFTIVIALSLLCSAALGQSVITLKVGTLNPKDAQAGLLVGIATGKQVDERIDFGLGADLFIRQFTQKATVPQETTPGGTTYQSVETEIDYSMFALPIMLNLRIKILPDVPISPYVGVSGGYEILFSREANYIEDKKDSRLYGGFGWQAMIGAQYSISSASAVLAELLYNGCTVKRNKGTTEGGLPISEKLDFSGIGFRVGVKLGG